MRKNVLELKLRRVGTSLGVILPKKELDEAGLGEGDLVRVPKLGRAVPRELYGIWKERPVRLLGGDE